MKRTGLMHCIALVTLVFGAQAQAGWLDTLLEQAVTAVEKEQNGDQTLTAAEINGGLKEALRVGTKLAIERLGKEDGYFGNELVKIHVPEEVRMVESGLRSIGMQRYADDFILALNRSAEQAVPETVEIFADAITQMSLEDARKILNGPDDAATEYFRKTAGTALQKAILPIVQEYTQKTEVTRYYKTMVASYDTYAAPLVEKSGLGQYMGVQQAGDEKPAYSARDLDGYITGKSMDGLFTILAEEEKKIRENPAARTTELLQKVFGSL
jgi:hypothetical protein